MKKLLLAFICLGLFVLFGRCNNGGGNTNDGTQTTKKVYPADSTKDSVKVKDTIDSIKIRKEGK